MYFYGMNLGPPLAQAILDHGTFIYTNLVKDSQVMLHTNFQVSEPSGSEEEDFLIFFYVFLWFQPRTPGLGNHEPWNLPLNKLGH